MTTIRRAAAHEQTPPALATQVFHIFIKATPQEIWDAITKPEFTVGYFHGGSVDMSGGRRVLRSPDGQVWNDDEIWEWDPPRRLVHGWRSLYDEDKAAEPQSRVTWEIEPTDWGACRLTVIHDRLEESPETARDISGPGWMFILSALKTLLETGEPIREF